MEYRIKWKGVEYVVGEVEYYGGSAIPKFECYNEITSGDEQIGLTLVALVHVPGLNRYLVMYEAMTEQGRVYFIYNETHAGHPKYVDLQMIVPGEIGQILIISFHGVVQKALDRYTTKENTNLTKAASAWYNGIEGGGQRPERLECDK